MCLSWCIDAFLFPLYYSQCLFLTLGRRDPPCSPSSAGFRHLLPTPSITLKSPRPPLHFEPDKGVSLFLETSRATFRCSRVQLQTHKSRALGWLQSAARKEIPFALR